MKSFTSGFATCGSLALCLGCLCYFLKLFQMYQEYLEGLVKRAVGLRDEDDTSILLGINFQFTLALLWLMATLLNLPTLFSWSQNIPHGLPLPADPSLIHAVILCGSLSVLWQNEGKPKVEKKYFSVLAIILQGLAIFIATFAMVTIYRLSFAISAVFVVVTTHQLISPSREQETEEEVDATSTLETPANEHPKAAESASDSEYEEDHKLNISKKKVISGQKPGVIKSASDVTDTGREEGLPKEIIYKDFSTYRFWIRRP